MTRCNLNSSELVVKQREIEKESLNLGAQQYLDSVAAAEDGERGADTLHARRIITQMTSGLADIIQEDLKGKRSMHAKVINRLNTERAVVIALRTLFNKLSVTSEKDLPFTTLAVTIGDALQSELKMESLQKENPEYMREVVTNWKSKRAKSARHKTNVLNHLITEREGDWKHWSSQVKALVGSYLIMQIHKNTDLLNLTTLQRGKKRVKQVTLSPEAVEWISQHMEHMAFLKPLHRPMVVLPAPWSENTRPYLTDAMNSTIDFVRCRGKKMKSHYKTVAPSVYNAVSLAQSTPWRINKGILDFITNLQQLPNPQLIPSAGISNFPDYPLPKELKAEDMDEAQQTIFREWKAAMRTLYSEDVVRRSNRQRLDMTLLIARDYEGYDEIFFPHSIDSRGRIYSIPTILQPQGDDIAKSLLEFSKGYKLTAGGLIQLKIQIASKFGLDKASRDERLQWFEDNEGLVLDIGTRPLDMLDTIADTDKPFQFVAACMDYASWKIDPDAPIHARVNKDGACNGLQHFAAMLSDGELGDSVNLTPATAKDEPKSVYKAVAKEVEKMLKQSTDEYAGMWLSFWHHLASKQDDKPSCLVDYKCMKRPVMTLPYSATMYSRMTYIKEYVRDKDMAGFFGTDYGKAVKYFADIVTEAMSTKIPSATLILDWLQESCRRILVEHSAVEWTTPLGLRVMNHQSKRKSVCCKLWFDNVQVRTSVKVDIDGVDARKVASAVAPNFVHSMDATHMLWIVQAAWSANITDLHLVHDDYGCHVNHGELLEAIARKEFARLYLIHQPLLDLYERYKDILDEPPAQLKSLDLNDLDKALYAFD